MEKSRFFKEVARIANTHGFCVSGVSKEGRLELSFEQRYLCRVDESGAVYYPQKSEAGLERFLQQIETARKYVTAVEQSPPLAAEGLPNGYHLLCESGRTVLAGKDMGNRGYQFVTWEWGHDRTGLNHGHYYEDYIAAREDFAFRSGMVPEHHRFSPAQAKALHQAISVALNNELTGTIQEARCLEQCREKLQSAYPDLTEQAMTPEQHPAQEPDMGM